MRVTSAAMLAVVLGAGLAGTAALAGCSDAPRTPRTAGMTADQVRAFLETDPAGRAALALADPGVRPFCGVDVLGGSPDGRWTYAWVLCSTFTVVDGRVEEGAGVSAPVRLDAVTRTATLPQDGAGYAPSIRAMFPADLVERALEHDVAVDRTGAQLRTAAERFYATATTPAGGG